jgi:hypothetical protein
VWTAVICTVGDLSSADPTIRHLGKLKVILQFISEELCSGNQNESDNTDEEEAHSEDGDDESSPATRGTGRVNSSGEPITSLCYCPCVVCLSQAVPMTEHEWGNAHGCLGCTTDENDMGKWYRKGHLTVSYCVDCLAPPSWSRRAMGQRGLASGWAAVIDDLSGDTYYWNEVTGVTQWDHPSIGSESGASDGNGDEGKAGENIGPQTKPSLWWRPQGACAPLAGLTHELSVAPSAMWLVNISLNA